jgi:hypothetical protein
MAQVLPQLRQQELQPKQMELEQVELRQRYPLLIPGESEVLQFVRRDQQLARQIPLALK